MKMRPYIGITDFASGQEVESMLAVLTEAFPRRDRDLMVGTMMSYKTLRGLPSKWTNAWPKRDQFSDIYPAKRDLLLNTLHYADYDGLTEIGDLKDAIFIAGHRVDLSTPPPLMLFSSTWSGLPSNLYGKPYNMPKA